MGFWDSLFGFHEISDKKANCKTNVPNMENVPKVQGNSEEFSKDILPEMSNSDIVDCSYNGVQIHYIPNMLKITYEGLLAQNGANEVYAAIGYGDNTQWDEVNQFIMHKTGERKYELLIFRKKLLNVNLAFKDSIGNWDNNNGKNYIFFDNSSKGSH